MVKFRDVKTLQKFAAAHASIHNHFNQDCHLNRRDTFKQNRSADLAEWRQVLECLLLAKSGHWPI
jgi:putative transposase